MGEQEKYVAAFDALTRTTRGQELAQNILLPYWPGIMPLFMNTDASDEDLKMRLDKIAAAKARIPRSSDAPDTNLTVLLVKEFDTLAEMARRQNAAANDSANSARAEKFKLDLGALIALGERLAELDTHEGANWFVKTSQLLLDLNTRSEDVMRLTNKGMKSLRERQPGLINPGTSDQEIELGYLRYLARFKILKAKAFERMGKLSQA